MSIEISYNNSTIASLSGKGTEVLDTSGKFLTDDLTIAYDSSGGGGSVATRDVSITDNTAEVVYYTDASMTVQIIDSGSRDLDAIPLPIGSLVVCAREGIAPPFPATYIGVELVGSYTVGSKGLAEIFKVVE